MCFAKESAKTPSYSTFCYSKIRMEEKIRRLEEKQKVGRLLTGSAEFSLDTTLKKLLVPTSKVSYR